jgi:hypothetical protein
MDSLEKSFASSSDTSKLLITLSTAVVAFCAATVNLKAADTTILTPITVGQRVSLASSWICLLLSTGIGVWTQLAITDVLSKGTPEKPPDPWNRKIIVPFQWQIVTFVLGVGVLVIYAARRLFG